MTSTSSVAPTCRAQTDVIAADFVAALTEHGDAVRAEGEFRFSGRHSQRWAIARAMNRDPRIFLLDETGTQGHFPRANAIYARMHTAQAG